MSQHGVRQAVLMVGGKGTRLLPLTENKPKPMLSVCDRPCIWYLIRSMARAGIEEVILGCGYKPGMMEALGDGRDLGVNIVYSYEDEPWDAIRLPRDSRTLEEMDMGPVHKEQTTESREEEAPWFGEEREAAPSHEPQPHMETAQSYEPQPAAETDYAF